MDLDLRHKLIVGTTRFGKSYYADKCFRSIWPGRFGVFVDQQLFSEGPVGLRDIDFNKRDKWFYLPARREELADFLEYVINVARGGFFKGRGCTIVIDEIHFFIPVHTDNSRLSRAVISLFEYGLRFGVQAVAISHSLGKINKRVRDLCTEQILFCSNLDNTLKNYGVEVSEEVDQHINQKYHYAKRLYDYHLELYNPIDDNGEHLEKKIK